MAKFVLFVLAAVWFSPNVALAQSSTLPQEVALYYEAHNFVAAFSTPSERDRLAAYRSEAELRTHTRSERLIEVCEHIRELKAHEWSVDSGIFFPKALQRRGGIRPGLAQIEAITCGDGGVLIAEVFIYALDSKTNTRFVALCKEGKTTSLPRDLSKVRTTGHREIHEWVQRNGKGFIEERRIALVENERPR